MYKAKSQAIVFQLYNKFTGDPVTGESANITLEISKDGGGFVEMDGTITEVDYGYYKITITATESTADIVVIHGVHDTNTDYIIASMVYHTVSETLASNAFDNVIISEPSGVEASGNLGNMVRLLYMRFFGKVIKDATDITVRNSDDDADVSTQVYTVVGDTQTLNEST